MPAHNYQLLIKNILKMPIAQASRKHIVYRGQERFTYPQFVERVNRLGGALVALGAKPGMRIAVMDWDSHRYLEAYFAIPMLGATLMMVNIRLSPEQIAYTVDHSEAEILLVNKDFFAQCKQIREKLPRVQKVICLADDGIEDDCEYGEKYAGEYEKLLAAAPGTHEFPDFDENTIATTFYTTGTTGLPKGVYFSHRQLVLHTMTLMSTLMMAGINGRISREDVYMPLTPMFHVHAWGFPYVATMMGMKQVYTGRFLPPVVLKLLATENVTVSHCVPTIMHMILSAREAANIDLQGWKVIIGGSAMPRPLCKAALARGIDIFTGYGMSETCPILTISQLTHDLVPELNGSDAEIDYRVSAGLPGAFCELAIVDDDMNQLPKDGVSTGEVVARTPALTAGYAKNPESSEALWKGGWLHTGDIGTIDPSGYLHILDRSKDVIKTGGEWISSIALEDIILGHPAISECAVIAVEDARWGERPIAVVVLKAGSTASEDDVKDRVRARVEAGDLSRYAIPDHVVFAESLEKTSVGKLDKKKMRAMYGGVVSGQLPVAKTALG
jgi:fatty-acyl-CoA synthase